VSDTSSRQKNRHTWAHEDRRNEELRQSSVTLIRSIHDRPIGMESVVASKPQAGARLWTRSQIVPIREYSNLSFPKYGQQRSVHLCVVRRPRAWPRARACPAAAAVLAWQDRGRGSRAGWGQVVEPVDRQRVDSPGLHGCVDGKSVGYSRGEASGGRMSSGRGEVVLGGA